MKHLTYIVLLFLSMIAVVVLMWDAPLPVYYAVVMPWGYLVGFLSYQQFQAWKSEK